MNRIKSFGTLSLFICLGITAGLAGQAKPAPASSQPSNFFKEVLDHKGQIQWRTAPPPGIPTDVCLMFKVCEGKDAPKFTTLPRSTEAGQAVGRGLFLTGSRDPKNPDAVVLEHQTLSELYFFLLTPDGNLQKAAYLQQGSTSWLSIGSSIAQPIFDKDKKEWHDAIAKLGAAGK